MYVARFSKRGILWQATLLEKVWSEEMMTNQIVERGSKTALFHSTVGRWIRNEIAREMVKRHELEILNG